MTIASAKICHRLTDNNGHSDKICHTVICHMRTSPGTDERSSTYENRSLLTIYPKLARHVHMREHTNPETTMQRSAYIAHTELTATAAARAADRAAWDALLSLPAVPTRRRPGLFARLLSIIL